jgi:hypothetical protein
MKKKTIAVLIAIMLLFAFVVPAAAITDGELDGEGHPYVGLMAALDADGNYLWRCSGTLLSPTIFLTAGHCTEDDAVRATIWFDADVESGIPDNGYPINRDDPHIGEVFGTTYTHPHYYDYPWFMNDLGIVILDEPVFKDEYGALPGPNQLDGLKKGKKGATFTSVGYGLQAAFPTAAEWKDVALKVRMVSHPFLIQINTPGFTGDFSLLLSNNHATGGTCFGDSGGPNFLGDSNIIAGVTSYGMNPTCAGTGGVMRVDGEFELDWIQGCSDGDCDN